MSERRTIHGLTLTLALILAAPLAAWAHAFLEQARPGAGAVLEGRPDAVVLRFDRALELAFCRVEVEDESHRRVDEEVVRFAGNGQTVLRATLRPLAPGDYRVFWSVLTRDGHRTEGDYNFTVR